MFPCLPRTASRLILLALAGVATGCEAETSAPVGDTRLRGLRCFVQDPAVASGAVEMVGLLPPPGAFGTMRVAQYTQLSEIAVDAEGAFTTRTRGPTVALRVLSDELRLDLALPATFWTEPGRHIQHDEPPTFLIETDAQVTVPGRSHRTKATCSTVSTRGFLLGEDAWQLHDALDPEDDRYPEWETGLASIACFAFDESRRGQCVFELPLWREPGRQGDVAYGRYVTTAAEGAPLFDALGSLPGNEGDRRRFRSDGLDLVHDCLALRSEGGCDQAWFGETPQSDSEAAGGPGGFAIDCRRATGGATCAIELEASSVSDP